MRWLRRWFFKRYRKPPPHPFRLSRPVMTLSNSVTLTIADMCRGCLITGEIGSGKRLGRGTPRPSV